jgi:hypothetical protein
MEGWILAPRLRTSCLLLQAPVQLAPEPNVLRNHSRFHLIRTNRYQHEVDSNGILVHPVRDHLLRKRAGGVHDSGKSMSLEPGVDKTNKEWGEHPVSRRCWGCWRLTMERWNQQRGIDLRPGIVFGSRKCPDRCAGQRQE